MRYDLNKVLVEDPRRGGLKFSYHRNSKLNATFDEDAFGGKESMMTTRRRAKGDRKSFGDHLSPLRGYIRKCVGRKWDDVYSEICRTFDKRAVMNNHILEHTLADFVNVKTKIDEEGRIYIHDRWSRWYEVEETAMPYRDRFYVHPVTGILCSSFKDNPAGTAKRIEAERHAKLRTWFVEHTKSLHLYKEDGTWYVYELKMKPEKVACYVYPLTTSMADRLAWPRLSGEERRAKGVLEYHYPDYASVEKPKILRDQPWNRYSWGVLKFEPKDTYFASKKAANKKLLKKYGLKND